LVNRSATSPNCAFHRAPQFALPPLRWRAAFATAHFAGWGPSFQPKALQSLINRHRGTIFQRTLLCQVCLKLHHFNLELSRYDQKS
jgi:hypothetical protein